MIEITPAILGPGIEEEYADAMAAIRDLRTALGERRLTNDTPDGRLLLEIAWLEQEIGRGRLPIPVGANTVFYLVGSGELNHIPGVQESLGRLYVVLKGIGLIKPRHIPVLVSMIDALYADAHAIWVEVPAGEQEVMEDLRARGDALRREHWPSADPLARRYNGLANPVLNERVANFSNRIAGIRAALFRDWRPSAAKKPPLDPPKPGLPREAPPEPDRPWKGWFRP
ncbi:hypothetical protein LK533_02315 [Sphingomonas sp. PL-96]|uniref:hypothetical protein n=1 Tax=Sphingomonas sp. PL-96 TaxID=2887201 RepID=UPI001E4985AB|nr:hypothetical protein [Sphingomonas sp. PL-96]MCC2975507.1 hypothetical protein [Sphingomonas sp. PL-96]